MFASLAFAADPAPAAAPQGGPGFFLVMFLIFGIFYFLLIRPQQKRAKDHQVYLGNLKKGDAVVTNGGIHGVITGLTDKIVTLEIADKVRVKVSRQHILGSAAAVSASQEEGGKSAAGG